MFTNDPYMVKTIEYLTGIGSLLLFVLFWRYATGEPLAVAERVRAWSGQLSDWFRLPAGIMFHPAHGWARADEPGLLTVGLDDFAQQLVGPIDAIQLPAPGARLRAGATGWTLHAAGKAVDMLAPVSGEVVAVNDAVRQQGDLANADPYGRGWLVKLRVPRAADATSHLLTGAAARGWIQRVSDRLTASMTPELGHLCQDGGLPVHGIARGIDPECWDEVAREFLHPTDARST